MRFETVTTRPVRWNEIYRALIIFGIVGDSSKSSCLKVANLLQKRVDQGLVKRVARGQYTAKFKKPR